MKFLKKIILYNLTLLIFIYSVRILSRVSVYIYIYINEKIEGIKKKV